MMKQIQEILDVRSLLDGVDAVLFDMDDTLYGEKEYVRSGYRAVARYFPGIEDMEQKLWDAFLKKEKAFDYVLQNENKFSDENLQLCVAVYRNQEPDIHLYEGVDRLLKELRESGKLLGLITDGRPEGQRAKIRALGIAHLFDEIIVTDELGGPAYRKPCAKAFELMQARFDVPFERMVYIGDNIRKDFVAPQMLNMQCIWLRNRDGLYFEDIPVHQ